MILSHGTRCILRSPGHTHDGEHVCVERLNEGGTVLIKAYPPGTPNELSVVLPKELHPVESVVEQQEMNL